jgi:ribosome hibernation promoting factor
MKVNIQAPWEVNDYLNQLIVEKIEKISEVDSSILHADVFLKTGVNSGIEDKLIEVRLRMPGPEVFAQAADETFEKAIASAAEKLRKQLIKKKQKLSKR